MVEDNIANYRLTAKIIEKELLQMFPKTNSVALEIKVSEHFMTWRGVLEGRNANIALGKRRCFYIPHPTKVDRGEWRAHQLSLTSLTDLLTLEQDQKRQILSKRLRDRREPTWERR
jgi:hypothetical protein